MRIWVTVALVVAAAAGLVYVGSLNTATIEGIDLGFASFESVPLWYALSSSTVFGAALAALIFSWPILRLKLRARRSEKRIAVLEQELHGLRTLPIADADTERRLESVSEG